MVEQAFIITLGFAVAALLLTTALLLCGLLYVTTLTLKGMPISGAVRYVWAEFLKEL